MTHLFTDLEQLAQQDLDISPQDLLASQAPHYANAPLSEIFDLLESAVETYAVLAATLSPNLRASAEQEIEFYYSLVQEKLGGMLHQAPLEHLFGQAIAA